MSHALELCLAPIKRRKSSQTLEMSVLEDPINDNWQLVTRYAKFPPCVQLWSICTDYVVPWRTTVIPLLCAASVLSANRCHCLFYFFLFVCRVVSEWSLQLSPVNSLQTICSHFALNQSLFFLLSFCGSVDSDTLCKQDLSLCLV